ncbi:MAG: F0F1 ATP synthase subunit C [Thermoplasmata archaeon]|nr:F0F1 ATP synthase subunit C [Thermoplasmata archaeon]
MLPIAFGVLGTGLLFAGYNLAVSKNPEEVENLFNSTLMGFALMETFIFLSFVIGYVIYIM